MPWPNSVRSRLAGLLLVTLLVPASAAWILVPDQLERVGMRRVHERLKSALTVATSELGPLLENDDLEAVRSVVQSVSQVPDILVVELRDLDDRPTVRQLALHSPDLALPESFTLGVSGDGRMYGLSHPVRATGRDVGRMVVTATLEPLHREIGAVRRGILLAIVVLLALGVGFAVGISHYATRPIREIAATAEEIASGRREARAVPTGDDEVAALARSFNRMLDRLEESEATVTEARRSLEQILAGVPAGIAVLDPECRVLYANRGAVPDPAVRRHALGRRPADVLSASGNRAVGEVVERLARTCLAAGRDAEEEVRVTLPDGHRQVVILASPVKMNGSSRVLICALDVTHLREAEQALEDREVELRQAQKMEAVGRLAGGVAHDFNNLLTVISGQAELAVEDLDPTHPAHGAVEEVLQASARASDLTRQLLAFSRKEVQTLELLDLSEAVRHLSRLLERLLGEDVELRNDLAAGLPGVEADPSQIQQILMNLAVNARDAMPAGGTLTLRTRSLPPEEGAQHGWVRLSVSDTGVGMDAQTQELVFEPFFTTKDVGQGTGLGLSTVYGIVQQTGGGIRIESAPAQGTTFHIDFPARSGARRQVGATPARAADGAPTGVEESDRARAGGETADGARAGGEGPDASRPARTPNSGAGSEGQRDLTGVHLMVVEDEPMVRSLLLRQLSARGLKVTAVDHPQVALERVLRGDISPDLVLTDVIMPGMSGVVLAQTLRERFPDLPILFMTGYARAELDRIGARELEGALIRKPFRLDQLMAALERVAGRRPTHGEGRLPA